MTDWMWCSRFHLLVAWATRTTRAKLHIKMQFNFAVNCTEIVFALVLTGVSCLSVASKLHTHTHSVFHAIIIIAITHWPIGHKSLGLSLGAWAKSGILIIICECGFSKQNLIVTCLHPTDGEFDWNIFFFSKPKTNDLQPRLIRIKFNGNLWHCAVEERSAFFTILFIRCD